MTSALWFMAGALTALTMCWLLWVVRVVSKRPPKPPPPPRCRAVLKSGEQCIYDAGHDSYHRAQIFNGVSWNDGFGWRRQRLLQQEYVWEDPACGIHSTGFYPK